MTSALWRRDDCGACVDSRSDTRLSKTPRTHGGAHSAPAGTPAAAARHNTAIADTHTRQFCEAYTTLHYMLQTSWPNIRSQSHVISAFLVLAHLQDQIRSKLGTYTRNAGLSGSSLLGVFTLHHPKDKKQLGSHNESHICFSALPPLPCLCCLKPKETLESTIELHSCVKPSDSDLSFSVPSGPNALLPAWVGSEVLDMHH